MPFWRECCSVSCDSTPQDGPTQIRAAVDLLMKPELLPCRHTHGCGLWPFWRERIKNPRAGCSGKCHWVNSVWCHPSGTIYLSFLFFSLESGSLTGLELAKQAKLATPVRLQGIPVLSSAALGLWVCISTLGFFYVASGDQTFGWLSNFLSCLILLFSPHPLLSWPFLGLSLSFF